jgi:hypothetical protein
LRDVTTELSHIRLSADQHHEELQEHHQDVKKAVDEMSKVGGTIGHNIDRLRRSILDY